MTPTFIVVAGANGAGKSTLTRLGREGFQSYAVLDPDAIAKSRLVTGVGDGAVALQNLQNHCPGDVGASCVG